MKKISTLTLIFFFSGFCVWGYFFQNKPIEKKQNLFQNKNLHQAFKTLIEYENHPSRKVAATERPLEIINNNQKINETDLKNFVNESTDAQKLNAIIALKVEIENTEEALKSMRARSEYDNIQMTEEKLDTLKFQKDYYESARNNNGDEVETI